MNPDSMNQVIDLLSSHRSVRKFTDRPIADNLLHTIVKAAQCAATSSHVQAYTIIRVQDKGNRKKIANLSGPQPWVEQAPLFLVFCADLTPDIKPRLPLELVLKEDSFFGDVLENQRTDKPKTTLKNHLKSYDQTCRDYYLSRDSNLKDQTWTRQMADFMGKVSRPHMKSFLEKRGFFLR